MISSKRATNISPGTVCRRLKRNMVGLLTIVFILLEIPVIYCYSSVTCPVISSEVISATCNSRTEHLCLSDSECGGSRRSKCCPSSRNGGCSLMCVEPRALEGCPIPLDFAMIVDTSGSISRSNFKKLIKFIQDMLDGFDISEKGTHIAVIGYSTKASVVLRFNDFSGAFLNSANLKRAISKIKL
ncbi:matrilin-3-like [Porites lutea]|uniref:matrilin-3-like n=1 Tax=Porites lutea TaxID=51062 RepID=UPI003CC5C55F